MEITEAKEINLLPEGVIRKVDELLMGSNFTAPLVLSGDESLAARVAIYVAKHGNAAAIISRSHTNQKLAQQILCIAGNIYGDDLKTGDIGDEALQSMMASAAKLANLPICLVGVTPDVTEERLFEDLIKLKAEQSLSLIIIDDICNETESLNQTRNDSLPFDMLQHEIGAALCICIDES